MASRVLINSYMNVRRLLKNAPRGTLEVIFGEQTADFIRNHWGNEGGPNMSFAAQFERRLETLSPSSQAFWEEFFDEAWDSFTEAGYIIASELDAAIASAKAGATLVNGQFRGVSIQPDSRIEGEQAVFVGREETLKPAIQTYINTHRLVHNRDIGQIVGQPAEDWYRAKTQRRKLTLFFRSTPRPPYYRRDNEQLRSATYSVPDPKITLTWSQIKRAARQFTWGRYRCTANLDNGRQMAVYGASPAEAEEKLRDLLDLSEANIITLTIAEEKERNSRLRKQPTVLYPAWATVLVRRPALDLNGRTDIDGNSWDEEHVRFALWTEEEPEEFSFVQFGVGSNANP